MAIAEFADIGIYRVRWSGVGWGGPNRRILTFQHHLIHFSTLQMEGHSASTSEIQYRMTETMADRKEQA